MPFPYDVTIVNDPTINWGILNKHGITQFGSSSILDLIVYG